MITIPTIGWIFSIAVSLLFWAAACLLVLRLGHKGAGFGDIDFALAPAWDELCGFFSKLLSEKKGLPINIKIIIFGLFIRAAVLVMSVVFLLLMGRSVSISSLFNSFIHWDANSYLVLADIGYRYIEDGRHLYVVFFPLYPYLIRLVSFPLRNLTASAYVVSFASYLAGLCYLYHLVRIDFDEATAWWAVVLISIFPHSIFFGAPHTESLYLLTTAATLYYIRKHKWLLAGIAGGLATATRMVGVMLIAAAAVEFVMHYELFAQMRRGRWGRFFGLVFKKGVLILIMFTGIAVYLAINWRVTGDPLRFLQYQELNWNNGFQYFGIAIRSHFNRILPHIGNWQNNSLLYIALPNILGLGFTIWMITYASMGKKVKPIPDAPPPQRKPLRHRRSEYYARRGRPGSESKALTQDATPETYVQRHNAAYIAYALGYTFVSFSMVWLLSGGRYAAALVPSFIFLADYVMKKPRRRVVVSLVFIGLLLPILRMYIIGGYVM